MLSNKFKNLIFMKKSTLLLGAFLFLAVPSFAQEQTEERKKETLQTEKQQATTVQSVEIKELKKAEIIKIKEAQPIQREEKIKEVELEKSTKE